MHPKRDRAPDCAAGRHRPTGTLTLFESGVSQARCRDCGCALVRSHAVRRWRYSGELGG
jgi:hypothetical protein